MPDPDPAPDPGTDPLQALADKVAALEQANNALAGEIRNVIEPPLANLKAAVADLTRQVGILERPPAQVTISLVPLLVGTWEAGIPLTTPPITSQQSAVAIVGTMGVSLPPGPASSDSRPWGPTIIGAESRVKPCST